MVPKYSLCGEYIYLTISGHPYFNLNVGKDIQVGCSYGQRNVRQGTVESIYGRAIGIENERTDVFLESFPHRDNDGGEIKSSTLMLIPASLSTAKVALLMGNENEPLRVLFLPYDAPPEMRFLDINLPKIMHHFGVERYPGYIDKVDNGN